MVVASRRFNRFYSGENYIMTKQKYSPTTQAVSDAAERVCWDWGNLCPASADTIAAAALRAAVNEVLPENANPVGDEHDDAREDQWMRIRYKFLSIISELEENK
jgi:hypothetical protein